MGSTSCPFGFRPVRHLNGMPWNGQTYRAFVEDSYGTALYVGDPVVTTGDVGVDITHGRHGPSVQIATADEDNPISGIIVSIEPVDLGGDVSGRPYIAASTGGYVNLVIDPWVIYCIQGDGTAITSDECWQNINFESGAGSTYTGVSGWKADTSAGGAADATDQGFILNATDVEGNDITDTYALLDVLINLHTLNCSNDSGNDGCMLGV